MKKLLVVLLALAPMCMYGQKFGNINSNEVAMLMPEYKTSQTELETLQKQYDEELQYMMNEYSRLFLRTSGPVASRRLWRAGRKWSNIMMIA